MRGLQAEGQGRLPTATRAAGGLGLTYIHRPGSARQPCRPALQPSPAIPGRPSVQALRGVLGDRAPPLTCRGWPPRG